MRTCVLAMVTTLLAAANNAHAQSSATESSPQGPRTEQNSDTSSDQDEIRRLREQLDGLTRKLEGLSMEKPSADVDSGSLSGMWSGAVSCRNRHYAVVLSINEQTGSIGKGDWSYTGSGTGSDIATLSPTASDGKRYVLVTAKSNTYDYDVTIDGDRMDGMSTRDKCQIFMERAKR